jgi:membrane protein implicated in regulation of membrane protease activity
MTPQQIVGMEGVVRQGGMVFVRGELWQAESDAPLRPGEHVLVEALEGLSLRVRAV